MSRVSIVIPAFNSAEYIRDTVQSCLSQTHKDIEIIVVDDGSTDNTRDVVQDLPVTYIYQENKGPAAARNNGWRAANSEYLQFLDADDILLPTKIEKCLQAFTSDVDVVYTDYELRSPDLKEGLPTPHTITPEGKILDVLLASTSSFSPIHTPLIRRSTAERTRKFNEQLKITEDWYFWIELSVHGAVFRYLDEVLVWYRATPTSLSKDRVKMAQARLSAAEALSQLPLPEGFDLGRLLTARHHVLGLRHWAAGHRSEARKQFWQAIRSSPQTPRRHLKRYYLILMTYFCRLETAQAIMRLKP